eukprot:2905775-Amphidinium_carterae.2
MNFVPINAYLTETLGEVSTLPRSGQWAMVVMGENEVMAMYGEDQSSSLYLYALPPAWRKYMVFNRRVHGAAMGMPELGLAYVAATVCPMRWALAVAAMQHVGRRLAVASPPIGAEITLPDLRGDRPLPADTANGA